jgi:hypothetical protein
MTNERVDLLAASMPQTRLPADPADDELAGADPARLVELVAANPTSSLGWALLAEQSLAASELADDVTAYAYARTGYHRGLDALRRNGWKGTGPIPWSHEPNRGFLRALWALSVAAGRIGDEVEQQRCADFLRESTLEGYRALATQA